MKTRTYAASLVDTPTAHIVKREVDELVKNKSLRLPISKINPTALERFDPNAISRQQRISAPFLTSLLDVCVGIERNNQSDSGYEDGINSYDPVTEDEAESLAEAEANFELEDEMPATHPATSRDVTSYWWQL